MLVCLPKSFRKSMSDPYCIHIVKGKVKVISRESNFWLQSTWVGVKYSTCT